MIDIYTTGIPAICANCGQYYPADGSPHVCGTDRINFTGTYPETQNIIDAKLDTIIELLKDLIRRSK